MKLGFIGLGNMGRAIASGLVQSGAIDAKDVCGYAPHRERLEAYCAETGITPMESAVAVAEACDTVLIAVKPYIIGGVLEEIRTAMRGKALLSVALGWDYEKLSAALDATTRVQFIMPNTPALVQAGVLLFEEKNSLLPDERAAVMELFNRLGVVEELPTHLMGIGGTVSGCGPAFCAMMIEALADAGVKYGLPRASAYRLASQMCLGTAKLQIETGMHPGVLKDGVCSPAGTTIRGVEALEKNGMRAAFMEAVRAAMRDE